MRARIAAYAAAKSGLVGDRIDRALQRDLHREQGALPYTHEEIERMLDGLCFRADKVHLRSRWWPVLTDADDEAMVHLAVESRTTYLVTHNVRHLQPAVEVDVSVVTPAEFLRTLRGKL